MKFLFTYHYCGPAFVIHGWANVLRNMGHEVYLWNFEDKSAHDVFHEFEPDVFIGRTFEVSRAIEKCIRARPRMRVVLYASVNGEVMKDFNREEYPVVCANISEIAQLEKLKAETGKPDFVYLHVNESYLEYVLGGWRNIGIKPVSILNAADVYAYHGGRWQTRFDSSVSFVGGKWGYKSRVIDRYIVPMCHPSFGHGIKIWGNQPWDVPQYLGMLPESDAKHVFASAKVCPSIGEPHSIELFPDIVERYFKVPMAGGFVVGGPELGLEEVFGKDVIPTGKSPKDYQDTVKFFVENHDARCDCMEKQYHTVWQSHTYFHRVVTMFKELGMKQEEGRCISLLQATREHLCE